MTARYLSPTNTFLPVPTREVINYIRKPSEFTINRWMQIVESPAPTGLYFQLDRDQPVRVVTDAERRWEDGADSPAGTWNLSNFTATEFRCQRYAEPFRLGEEAVEAAQKHGAFDPIVWESMQTASQAMTNKTKNALGILETSGNWPTGTTDTASNLGGGFWGSGTSTSPNLKQGIETVYRKIRLATNGVAKIGDLRLLLNPTDAVAISKSQEIHDYMKSSPYALPVIKGEIVDNPNVGYGLPSHLYGVEVIVEDTPYVNTYAKADGSDATADTNPGRTYAKTANSAIFVYRPEGLDGVFGTRSFTTIQQFYHKYEMSVEMRHDTWQKRYEGRVIDWYVFKLVAPHTGFLVTSLLS